LTINLAYWRFYFVYKARAAAFLVETSLFIESIVQVNFFKVVHLDPEKNLRNIGKIHCLIICKLSRKKDKSKLVL